MGEAVTAECAREIIENIAGFFQILSEWEQEARSGKDNTKVKD